jgi:hypothetical protein
MQIPAPALFLILVAAGLGLPGCSSPAENANANSPVANSASSTSPAPKDNIEELGMLVRLPFEPEEVAWEESPEQKKLTAVMRFSPENAAKMAAEISKAGPPTPEKVSVESWFPNELLAQGELTGESVVKGHSYTAEPYLNPPYTKGRITQIESTDYFILQISS